MSGAVVASAATVVAVASLAVAAVVVVVWPELLHCGPALALLMKGVLT
jgi:hypothetical protein